MPQFATIIYSEDADWTQPEYAQVIKEYAEFGQAIATIFRGGAALYPTSTATTVKVTGGKGGDVAATDGPYAETKEALTGFYLIEAADQDEANDVASRIPAAWYGGSVEVRPVMDLGRSSGDYPKSRYAAMIYDRDVDYLAPEQASINAEFAQFQAEVTPYYGGGAGLQPTSTATTVTVPGGRGTDVVVSDGPYAETKEALIGVFLIAAADLDQAITVAAMVPSAWHGGAVEVRPVIDFSRA